MSEVNNICILSYLDDVCYKLSRPGNYPVRVKHCHNTINDHLRRYKNDMQQAVDKRCASEENATAYLWFSRSRTLRAELTTRQ